MWTTHVAIADHDRLDTVASEEFFDFLLHFRILLYAGADPWFDDGLGPISNDDPRSDLRRNLIVRAVEGDRADGKLRLGRTTISAVTAILLFLPAAAGTRVVA